MDILDDVVMRMSQSLENSVKTNKKLAEILEKNGWIKSTNGKIPNNPIESFFFDQTNCTSEKCEKSKIALYRTKKDVISLFDAHKLIKEKDNPMEKIEELYDKPKKKITKKDYV